MTPGNDPLLTLFASLISFLCGYYFDPNPAPTPSTGSHCVNATAVEKPWLVVVAERESFAREAGGGILVFLVVLLCCCNCCSSSVPRSELRGRRIVPQ
jgi:hypothetical protein